MDNIDYDAFLKKYGMAINGLSQRISGSNKSKEAREQLTKKLYQDALANQVNMSDMTMAMAHFYQGNVAGQVKMNEYVEKYK